MVIQYWVSKNEVIREEVGLPPIEDKIREIRPRWFNHITKRYRNAPVQKREKIDILDYKIGRERPKKNWSDMVRYENCGEHELE